MNIRAFTNSQSKHYVECSEISKGVLGEKITKRGYLEFDTLEEAQAAATKIANNEFGVTFSARPTAQGFYQLTPVAVAVETVA